ncbi:MAG: sodium:solute symporter, partial [Flavobacteriales bacterium]|nr:sodium:solute symporter [Flavobacteriales bacterium]
TYGPLLGLFAFGVLTKRQIKDQYAWVIALLSIILCFLITSLPKSIIGDYIFHWEILPINGLITFLGLLVISRKGKH